MSLILIDGSALVYRSHYAFASRPLTSPTGEVTSVVFGVCNGILRLIDKYNPDQLIVTFDMKGKNFRHDMYPEYKANRKPMPEELAEQLPRMREVLDAWQIPVLEKQGVEADDVIATIARKSVDNIDKVWIFTGDKDFMQLLDDRIGMLKPGRRGDEIKQVSATTVRQEYGLDPIELIQVFALAGDKADNIPGAPGVGDKTALKLIKEFGNLDGLFAGLEKSSLTPRLKRVLGENREQVYLSRDLFTIDCDVPLELNWQDYDTVLPVNSEVTSLLQELGLRNVQKLADKLATKIGQNTVVPEPETYALQAEEKPADIAKKKPTKAATTNEIAPEKNWQTELGNRNYCLLDDTDKLASWLGKLDTSAPVAIDTETDDLRRDTARLVGISMAGYEPSGERTSTAYVPVLWRDADSPSALGMGTLFPTGAEKSNLAEVKKLLAPVLATTDNLKIGQNLKFDEWILGRHGLPLAGPKFDTMLAAYVLDPGRRSHGLDDLVLGYLDYQMMPYKGLFATGDRIKDILSVDPEKLAYYAAEDADFTLRLYEILKPLVHDSGMEKLFTDVEMPVADVLLKMERNGIRINRPFLKELKQRFEIELADLDKQIIDLAGEPFNIQSPKQLATILFDKLGLKPTKKTATGNSTDVSVLTALSEEHALPGKILEYRQVAKLQNTYVETLPKLANPDTGLIHTSYNQAVAATGRLSSSDPNLQNIPIRTDLGRLIRQAFVPRKQGNVFISADYSQVELRLLAHLADDPGLLRAFSEGADVHKRTAALIAGIDEDDVTAQMRDQAKAINFGVIYGMGARALAKQIDVTVKEASVFIESYFTTYPGVRLFIDQTKEQAHHDEYVETLLGRRRLLPDINSANNRTRSFQERIAVNTPIQGTAADLIKLAMIRVQDLLEKTDTGALLLLQVHDELVLEVPENAVSEVSELVRVGMQEAFELKVPLIVDINSGNNWSEAH